MNTFSSDDLVESAKVNANFTNLADGSEINDDVLLQRHFATDTWHDVTYENSWVSYGGEWIGAQYYKDAHGWVHLRGLVKSGTVGDVNIFTLPAGYRPEFRLILTVESSNANARCDITTSGYLRPITGSNTWFSLFGIMFKAYQ